MNLNNSYMALTEEFEKQGNWLFKYRSFLPLFILLLGIYLYLQAEMYPDNFILKGTSYELYYELMCLIIGLVGLSIRAYTVGYSPKNTSGRNTQTQVADTLNTTGIYSIVRHPLYVGNFLMWLGPAMLTGHFWFIVAFCFFFWIYYERIMFAEEQFLKRKFGQQYTLWSKEVPAFIPKLSNFEKSDLSFSWKKVVKKEINGLFALFFIFAVFDVMGEAIRSENDYNQFLIGMCVLIGLAYAVIKYLKKNTDMFYEMER